MQKDQQKQGCYGPDGRATLNQMLEAICRGNRFSPVLKSFCEFLDNEYSSYELRLVREPEFMKQEAGKMEALAARLKAPNPALNLPDITEHADVVTNNAMAYLAARKELTDPQRVEILALLAFKHLVARTKRPYKLVSSYDVASSPDFDPAGLRADCSNGTAVANSMRIASELLAIQKRASSDRLGLDCRRLVVSLVQSTVLDNSGLIAPSTCQALGNAYKD